MYQCMDCYAWMDVDYVIFHSRGKGRLLCPKCQSKADLYYHEPVESYCGEVYEMRIEDRTERFMQVLEEALTWERAA